MSMRHSDGIPRHLTVRAWSHVLVLVTAALLIGCGGKTDNDSESGDSQSATGNDSTKSLSLPNESTSGNAFDPAPGSGSRSPSGPATDGGMQLPDAGLPTEETAAPESGDQLPDASGPTKPGGGGIEMPDPNVDQTSATAPDANQDANQDGVTLTFASWTAIESHAKSTGKITVVDLWSTVCEPCVREFPGLVRLSNAMSSEVTCIGVSVDYDGRKTRPPESYSEKVGSFLTAVGADFDNYLCNTASDEVFTEVGLPSIPAVLIYDADGKLVKQFVDAGDTIGFSYDTDVIPFVKKLAG